MTAMGMSFAAGSRGLLLRGLALVMALCVAGTVVPARAQVSEAGARQLVETVSQQAIHEIATANIPQAQKIQRFRNLFTRYFDIPLISKLVLGRYSRTASAQEQSRFTQLFKDVTVYRWAGIFDEYQGETLTVRRVSPDESGFVVDTVVNRPNGSPVPVRWRLRPSGGRLQVIDLVVDGASMLVTQRQEYASIIQRQGGVSGLLTAMEQQLARYRREGPPPPPSVR